MPREIRSLPIRRGVTGSSGCHLDFAPAWFTRIDKLQMYRRGAE